MDLHGSEFGIEYDDGQEILEDEVGRVQKKFAQSKVEDRQFKYVYLYIMYVLKLFYSGPK